MDVQKRLSGLMGKIVQPAYQVDKTILGGIVIHMGNKVIDHSVQRKLDTLKDSLLAVKVH